ncbi:MAG: GMC oxidoreductase [Alphaproteobacteria bacterium]
MAESYDFIVIGSGFGGSVSALRLAEKGYRVCILEAGKRWQPEDFPKSNWNVKKFLWAPAIGCTGIQRIWLLRDFMGLGGAGVGGGSLVYANVLMPPLEPFFRDPQWVELDPDWQATLAPHYATARKMLGVTTNPRMFPADDLLKEYGEELNRSEHFAPTEVGVFFGEPGETVPDPYFDGRGPARTGCDFSGACMIGCRTGGKNTLDKNYLYLAEQLGAKIFPETRATAIQSDGDGGYLVHSQKATALFARNKKVWRAKKVVVSAGTLNTLDLLLRCKRNGYLPDLSDRLGYKFRTNSEVLVGARTNQKDVSYSEGIAITSILNVTDETSIEVARYPEGSDVMGALASVLTDSGTKYTRPLKYFWRCLTHPLQFLKSVKIFGWAKRTIILLVMQVYDNSLQIKLVRSWLRPWRLRLVSKSPEGGIPTYIPEGNAAAKALAEKTGGFPQGAISEVLLNRPLSAHLLGGCPIAAGPETGVVNKYGEAFGHDGLFIIDGSIMPANLGVNPSLTITALAEHAMSAIPPKTEP